MRCRRGLFIEAARYRACAARTARISLVLGRTRGLFIELRAITLALRGLRLRAVTLALRLLPLSFTVSFAGLYWPL